VLYGWVNVNSQPKEREMGSSKGPLSPVLDAIRENLGNKRHSEPKGPECPSDEVLLATWEDTASNIRKHVTADCVRCNTRRILLRRKENREETTPEAG